MKKSIWLYLVLCVLFSVQFVSAESKGVTLSVDVNNPIGKVQPTMWGLFFEDINFAADGGLYAEKIKNNSFEFANPMTGWGRVEEGGSNGYNFAATHKPGPNKKYMTLQRLNDKGTLGIQNSGFRGIGLKKDETYRLTFIARKTKGNSHLVFQLVSANGKVLGKAVQQSLSSEWAEYELSLPCSKTDINAGFRVLIEGEGEIDIDLVSLFPTDTWKGRKRGLRKDIAQLLADMNPGFLRFPGGCIVEGFDLGNRYEWKKTLGPMANREQKINRWNIEFAHRPTPDYYQSFGIGFFEYFQFAEDMGAAPLPIVSCGLACQFNSGEMAHMGEEMQPYIDDALDLIEFANGPVDSEWGSVRAEMGHPESFNLEFIGIGNENWGPQYIERAQAFETAIKAKYPDVKIVSTSGPFPDGKEFEYLWGELVEMDAYIIDEHYYRNPPWFFENADRYDSYDRNGPKVFAGEYAAQSVAIASPDNKNNWECALSEAAFMTGLERNADLVHMASYAPMLAHVDGWQWTPDLVWFDNLSVYGTPNYYVQKLFATNKGDVAVPVTCDKEKVVGQKDVYASAVVDKEANELVIKIVNSSKDGQAITVKSKVKLAATGTLLTMASDDLTVVNSIAEPTKIAPVKSEFESGKKSFTLDLPGQSFTVARIGLK